MRNLHTGIRALFTIPLLSACAVAPGSGQDICMDAIQTIADCTGETPQYPAEGCIDSYADAGREVVDGGCDGIGGAGGKTDEWWCNPTADWLDLCTLDVPVEEAIAIDGLAEVCPEARRDALCEALRQTESSTGPTAAGHLSDALGAVRSQLGTGSRESVLRDRAVRYTIRERATGLFVWNVVTQGGELTAEPADYADRAEAVLREHFPHYDARRFRIAQVWLPPRSPAQCADQVVLLFPGVARLIGRQEFSTQVAALATAMPCLHPIHVNSGSFVDPGLNAVQARLALDQLDAEYGDRTPVHMVGYSQGSSNALRTLVDYPEIAARSRSVITMNSAAGGSEVGDLGYWVLDAFNNGPTPCAEVLDLFRPLCEWAVSRSPRPSTFLLEQYARMMGVAPSEVQAFIEAEDSVSEAPDLVSFFLRHLAGIRSLSTLAADEFWTDRGDELPRGVAYLSFASVITDTERNLPTTNGIFYRLLEHAGGGVPYNDMQVRLANQRMRGRIARAEVRMPVAEGNHWQWALGPGAVDEAIMPREMATRIPQPALLVGYFQALYDVGVVESE